MAKIQEETITIKFSKLVKNNDNAGNLIQNEVITAIEQVAQELVGESIIVEVIQN